MSQSAIDRARTYQPELVAIRHDIHAHPELGLEEVRTADIVARKLEEWGIEVHRGVGVTGVVGVLRNGNGQASVGLRADMDALPILEATELPYASQNPGRMHACGHDGHTTMLLGAAKYLAEKNVDHLLLDLPSVDREVDDGKLLAHRAFWEYPNNTKFHRTITEFIFVPNNIFDGAYLLNLQTAPFENDAAPSRPVLFRILS